MGNTCAQDCAALNYNRSNEATFDMNAEHTAPQYEKIKVVTSQANAVDLPRLGLGAQSQESLSKSRHSVSEDRQGETTKVPLGVEEQFPSDFPLQPTLPVDTFPSQESFQPISIPVDDHDDRVAKPGQEKEEADPESQKDFADNLEREKEQTKEEEAEVKSQVMEEEVQAEVQVVKQKVEASGTADFGEDSSSNSLALELVFDVNGEKKTIQLRRRPLGAEFKKRMKGLTKIDKIRPHSYASELGMKVGWAIQSIGGEDMSEKSYAEVQVALKNGMLPLPFTLDAK